MSLANHPFGGSITANSMSGSTYPSWANVIASLLRGLHPGDPDDHPVADGIVLLFL